MKNWLTSLFYSTFYPFIPVGKRDKAEHLMAGGMIFFALIFVLIFVLIFSIYF